MYIYICIWEYLHLDGMRPSSQTPVDIVAARARSREQSRHGRIDTLGTALESPRPRRDPLAKASITTTTTTTTTTTLNGSGSSTLSAQPFPYK